MAGDTRKVALDALVQIDKRAAFANILVPHLLGESDLDQRDRNFVTELVYGTTRMQRACDFLVDRYLTVAPPAAARWALRLGAYQLAFAGVAPHAAVAATVGATPARYRGMVNAVLRRVAAEPASPPWPDDGTRLSYPDWIVERLVSDLGHERALAALAAMNESASATVRADGYVQDRASQWVAELVDARAGMRVADVCAAPGGKATSMAANGASVIAGDWHEVRARRTQLNSTMLGIGTDRLSVVAADGTRPPLRPASMDRVLVDAPCSGLGVLRRRPDARWRIRADDLPRLQQLQRRLLDAAAGLVTPGGWLVYSVCTLSAAETLAVDEHLAVHHPDFEPVELPGEPWVSHGRGALLLPQVAGTDGMFLLRAHKR